MINLLPPETKRTIVYARRNRRLVGWTGAFAGALLGIAAVIAAGQLYLSRSTAAYGRQVDEARMLLKEQNLEETQKRVETLSGNLKLTEKVLSRQVQFSKLIRQVGTVMPANTVLTGLQLGKLDGGIDLDAVATDYQTATQVQVNLQDPANKIFDKADIVSITCGTEIPPGAAAASGTAQANNKYPCQVKLRAQFAKNNPFLFINNNVPPGRSPQ